MDSNYPLVTIITPCLNMESYIAKTIESVLSQDYPNLEYILVDGGSTDRTAEVICEIVAKNPGRMRLIVEPDSGVAEALGKGLAVARGEMFAYINADDTYFPGAVRTAAHWGGFETHLARHFQVISFDHRGMGRSTAPLAFRPKMKDLAADVVSLLRARPFG